MWGEAWGGAIEVTGVIIFTKMGIIGGTQPIWSISTNLTTGAALSVGAGTIVMANDNNIDISMVAGGGVNIDGGSYNISYV